MKKVVSTVGASILENYIKDGNQSNLYEYLKTLSIDQWESSNFYIENNKKTVLNWANGREDASAEIKSIIKISQELKDDLDVYLIATDTVISKFASQIISKWFENFNGEQKIKVIFNDQIQVIKKLQMENRNDFEKEGIPNLLNWFSKNFGEYFDDVIFNLTGGYKGLIPFLTILAQINKIPIYYKFEDTEELIKIPQTPLKINEKIFKDYEKEFLKLEKSVVHQKDLPYQFCVEAGSLIEQVKGLCDLNPIGRMFWNKYESKNFYFYCPKDVWNDIDKMPDIKKILAEKFWNYETRESKTENKGRGRHLVYDDGNNNNRIFYFKNNDEIYIYKVFNNESEQQKYLDTEKPVDHESIIKNSELKSVIKNNFKG